jgi:hypothetical protein
MDRPERPRRAETGWGEHRAFGQGVPRRESKRPAVPHGPSSSRRTDVLDLLELALDRLLVGGAVCGAIALARPGTGAFGTPVRGPVAGIPGR